jgi:mRNA interferase RelE/StbE
MALFSIHWKSSAVKELKKLSKDTISRIIKAVEKLSETPYPDGVRKLVGSEHTYRIRVGDYRVIYTILHANLVIEIVRVGHRKDIYNK